MPDEALISELETLFTEVINLGGQNERSQIVPNLTIQDANPAGQDGFVIISDDRDGDNILAKKVPSVAYADNDLVNVLFVRGGEAIAFQQGSQSPSGDLWEVVSGTLTDIFYDRGDVGIGKSIAPDATLEILDTSQAQLRLTHTEDTKFADFTLDTSHHLTIDPSSTGQIKLNATATIIDDLQHEGDPDTKLSFTDDAFEVTVGGLSMLKLTEAAQDLINLGPGSGDVDIDFNGDMFLRGSDGFFGIRITAASTVTSQLEVATTGNKGITASAWSTTTTFSGEPTLTLAKSHNASIGTLTQTLDGERLGRLDITGVDSNNASRSTAGFRATQVGAASAGNVPSKLELVAANNVAIMVLDQNQNVGIGISAPTTRLGIGAGAMEFSEMTAPGAGAANTARIYAEDDGSTNTQLRAVFPSGHIVTLGKDGGLATYTPTNVVTDRSYDANATSVAELADVLGTLIADLQAAGVLA